MKKKGFTLIELLAVIVILAVIALIATPLIMNVINDAKKNAFKDSAYGIIKAVELRAMQQSVEGLGGTYKVTITGDNSDITYSGDKPTEGIALVDANGQVKVYMCNDSYCATNTDASDNRTNEVRVETEASEQNTIKEKITQITADTTIPNISDAEPAVTVGYHYHPRTGTETYLGILYLDPTNLSAECDENSELHSNNGDKTGCMKWYVYDSTGGTTPNRAILDHNTTPVAMWNGANTNASMGTTVYEAKSALEGLTKPSTEITYGEEGNYVEYGSGWVITPEFPTAIEIANAGGIPDFDVTNSSSHDYSYFGVNSDSDTSKRSSYAWLYDNLNGCSSNGCTVDDTKTDYVTYHNTAGENGSSHTQPSIAYWTSTPGAWSPNYVWFVDYYGRLYNYNANFNQGVRPVISVSSLSLTN